jgi:hypothetical protein
MCVFTVVGVRFVRGTARYRTWREVERRALDGASRSLKREFEEVIMVEVLIEEMFGSDRSRSKDYKRAVVVDAGEKRKRQRTKEKTSFR